MPRMALGVAGAPVATGVNRYQDECGPEFAGTYSKLPRAVRIGLVLEWVLSGVCGKVGHSFYSPPMWKVSLFTLGCLSLGTV